MRCLIKVKWKTGAGTSGFALPTYLKGHISGVACFKTHKYTTVKGICLLMYTRTRLPRELEIQCSEHGLQLSPLDVPPSTAAEFGAVGG